MSYRNIRANYRSVLLRSRGRLLKIKNLTFNEKPIKKVELDNRFIYTKNLKPYRNQFAL